MLRHLTQIKNYSGCHEVIAQHLKEGMCIECDCKRSVDDKPTVAFINHFDSVSSFPYFSVGGASWLTAEPVEREVVTADRAYVFSWLESRKYLPDVNGDWVAEGQPVFYAHYWRLCQNKFDPLEAIAKDFKEDFPCFINLAKKESKKILSQQISKSL